MKKFFILIIIFFCNSIAFSADNQKQENTVKYKKSETISLDKFLYTKKSPQNWQQLGINSNGDVIYKGKVIIDDKGHSINDKSIADSYLYMKIFLVAVGAEPKEGCDTSDYKNGIYGLGCYIYESDE